jgi:GNAT superfamily N-acetyltransferase
MPSVTIRPAQSSDAATIVQLVRELAAFEGLEDQVRITEADLLRDGFGDRAYFECLLAEVGGKAVGFALYFHNYSTFEGRPGIYVEDLYIAEAARGAGVGRLLIARLARIALERECRRLDLSVLHWNPARGFYDRLGFRRKTDWLPYRLSGAELEQLAAQDS